VWLKKYLASREDSCKALFVTDTQPSRRMAIPTIRWAIKRLADRGELGANVYPHHFRHPYACQLLDNGAPLEFIHACSVTKKHRPLRFMLSFVVNDDESFTAVSFNNNFSIE